MATKTTQTKSARLDEDGLDLRASLFVRHYLASGNGADACRKAGYKREGRVQACELLKRPEVKRVIDRERKKILTELDAEPPRVIKELVFIAFSDPGKLFTPDGLSLRPIPQLDEATRRSISSLDFRRTQKKGLCSRVRFWSKLDSIRLLGEWLSMWKGRGDHSEQDRLDEIVSAIRESPAGRATKPKKNEDD
jgi:hypothetical protein